MTKEQARQEEGNVCGRDCEITKKIEELEEERDEYKLMWEETANKSEVWKTYCI